MRESTNEKSRLPVITASSEALLIAHGFVKRIPSKEGFNYEAIIWEYTDNEEVLYSLYQIITMTTFNYSHSYFITFQVMDIRRGCLDYFDSAGSAAMYVCALSKLELKD